jgi:hypothetical protein
VDRPDCRRSVWAVSTSYGNVERKGKRTEVRSVRNGLVHALKGGREGAADNEDVKSLRVVPFSGDLATEDFPILLTEENEVVDGGRVLGGLQRGERSVHCMSM